MKTIAKLPWHLQLDDNEFDAVLYAIEPTNTYKCEANNDGECNPLPFAIGTSDSDMSDPIFCLKHYFESINGDGHTNYKLIPHTDEAA